MNNINLDYNQYYAKNTRLNVAIIQLNATEDIVHNLAQMQHLLTQDAAKAADLVVLPECCNYRRLKKGPLHTESIPGPTTDLIASLAITHQQYILIGSIFETTEEDEKAYNTSVLINPMGDIQNVYRKIHLFDATVGRVRS